MKSIASKIQITSFDDLFNPTTPDETEEGKGQIREIPLADLHEFRNHPFKILDDDKMAEMVDSIRQYGVLVPGIVRERAEGGYEIVAGHRRKHASELAGKETMPVIVQELDDDEATIIMVDSNIQREELLPSEKAWAYKLKVDALKRQGKRTDLAGGTSGRFGQKLDAREQVAQAAGESSGRTVARFISLTKLIPPLLDMVDTGKISVNTAADHLSIFSEQEQNDLLSVMDELKTIPAPGLLAKLKPYSKSGKLTRAVIHAILSEEKPAPSVKITLKGERIKQYFPASYTQKQVEDIIFELLEQWSAQHKDEQQ